jgi:SAM-dependent methyltransferase
MTLAAALRRYRHLGAVLFNLDFLATIRAAEIERIVPLFRPGARILEIGAGTGQQAREIARRGFVVAAIEIPSSGYREARIFPVIDYDGRHIPFPDASFDIVFSSNVLEHVPDLPQLNREILRALRPGGYCVHVMPTHGWRFWTMLTLVPAAVEYALAGGEAQRPQPTTANGPPKSLFYKLRRHFGRHGEHGTLFSEHWLFHPSRWRRAFRADGFEIVEEKPLGIFYTGNLLLGAHLPVARRESIAKVMGSACHLYVIKPAPPTPRTASER